MNVYKKIKKTTKEYAKQKYKTGRQLMQVYFADSLYSWFDGRIH